jgi:hypothetical protein
MFNYDKEIKKIIDKIDIFNLNGCNQVVIILEYLKICPFIDMVAEYMEVSPRLLYDKLKYHLDEDIYISLLDDLQNRKYLIKENMKLDYKDKLKLADKNVETSKNENM